MRVASFGAAIAVIVIGAILGGAIGGVTGESVAIALCSTGAVGVASLVFLEVGLSEDREREREAARRRASPLRARRAPPRRRP